MSIVIDGTLGVSAVQDGIISESKLATGAVTDTKLTLTPNSQEVKDALNATGSAPIYACRAWVNFNGTGTVAIRSSGNVTSVTDNGTGDYTVNLTTAMPDANYSALGTVVYGALTTVDMRVVTIQTISTTAVRLNTMYANGSGNYDVNGVSVAIFR